MTLKKNLPFPLRRSTHEMATKHASFISVDEDFIHMELSSSDSVSCPMNSSPQHFTEFEFPTSSVSHEKVSSLSLADHLFYNGKLLPLHPLNNSNVISESSRTHSDLTDYRFPSHSSRPSISPPESSIAMREVNTCKFLPAFPSEKNGFSEDPPKKSWSLKLKIKQSTLGQRLKASMTSLFRKYDCSDKSCVSTSKNTAAEKKWITSTSRELIKDDGGNAHSRYFSGRKSSSLMSTSSFGSFSSSFSLSSSSRSSSVNSERESSIEGAIAHCKKSQRFQIMSGFV